MGMKTAQLQMILDSLNNGMRIAERFVDVLQLGMEAYLYTVNLREH